MAQSGILRTWDDQRGYGFIAPTGGGRELFVHISAFPSDGSRPTVGETLHFDVGTSRNGKPQALRVRRQALARSAHRNTRRPMSPRRSPWRHLWWLVLIGVAVWAWGQRDAPWRHKTLPTPDALADWGASDPSPARVDTPVAVPNFSCDGRIHCSQMRSCAEAKYFLKHCPGVRMDGNNDGVPCEQQWCTSPWAK